MPPSSAKGAAMPLSVSRITLTVLVPFGLGYYLSYLYRTVNIVIAKPLATDLSLDAADLGLLTSAYFIVFAIFQTPLGVILDRYGPRRIQVALLPLAAAGSALFAVSEQLSVLVIARGLIGLGVSGCLMAALQANALWFPRERLPLVNGFTAAFGTFGALSATVPVEYFYEAYGWRLIFGILAAVTLLASLLCYWIVPDRTPTKSASKASFRSLFRGLSYVYTNRNFWRIGAIAIMHNAVFLSYQALWLGPWLRDVAGMSVSSMAQTLLWANIGMFCGVVCFGLLADRAQSLGIKPVHVMGGGIGLSIVVHCLFALEQIAYAQPLCFAFGFLGSSGLLVFSVFGQNFPMELVGRVNTAQNMLSFILAFFAQWGIGMVIGLWPELPNGHYSPAGHQAALVTLIGTEIIAFIWFLWPRAHSDNPD